MYSTLLVNVHWLSIYCGKQKEALMQTITTPYSAAPNYLR